MLYCVYEMHKTIKGGDYGQYYFFQVQSVPNEIPAAELTVDEIRSLVDELIEAHSSWLPEYH